MTKLNTEQLYKHGSWPYLHDSMVPSFREKFYGPDNLNLFERNLKYQPLDWIYRNKNIEYRFNKLGLRMSKDLDELKKDILYVSGTSFSMGIGLAEEDRYSDILANKLSLDYINYSGPTFSIKLQVYTFFNYIQKYQIPKICVFEYPILTGYTFLDKEHALTFTGGSHYPRNYQKYIDAYDILKETDYFRSEALVYSNILRQYCKNIGCKLIEISYNHNDEFAKENTVVIDMDLIDRTNIDQRYARDIIHRHDGISAHPGIGVHRITTEKILEVV